MESKNFPNKFKSLVWFGSDNDNKFSCQNNVTKTYFLMKFFT